MLILPSTSPSIVKGSPLSISPFTRRLFRESLTPEQFHVRAVVQQTYQSAPCWLRLRAVQASVTFPVRLTHGTLIRPNYKGELSKVANVVYAPWKRVEITNPR